ncbi:MAG: hypothetical protein ACK5YZ_00225 [bacterium]
MMQQRRELLLDLARQAEARRQQVKQMLAQCATDRDRESELEQNREEQAASKWDECSTANQTGGEIKSGQAEPDTGDGAKQAGQMAGYEVALEQKDEAPTQYWDSASEEAATVDLARLPIAERLGKETVETETSRKAEPEWMATTVFEQEIENSRTQTVREEGSGLELNAREGTTESRAVADREEPEWRQREREAETGIARTSVQSSLDVAMEKRMSQLEIAFAELRDSVAGKLDITARITALESQTGSVQAGIEDLLARLAPVENRFEVLRGDLRAIEAAGDRWNEQIRIFDQIFASIGRDSQKLSGAFEALGSEVRSTQERFGQLEAEQTRAEKGLSGEIAALGDRMERLETDLMGAIGLLQSSEQEINELAQLRSSIYEMEHGFQRVLRAVSNLERPIDLSDTAAEREATANVLASLTKLVQGMRAAQTERIATEEAQPV